MYILILKIPHLGWVLIGYDCAGSKHNDFATFTYRGNNGFVNAIKLVHRSGKIGCHAKAHTNWGCSSNHRTNMYVTDIYNAVMYPSPVLTKPFQSGGWYHLPGYNHVSPFLVFSDVGTRFIYGGQTMRVWYGEDLYNYTEGDNHGFTCFQVYLHFV